MRTIFVLLQKELLQYFATPVAYVFISVFLFSGGALTFYVSDFFNRNTADLYTFFLWHPWLYVFFLSAITMRLWSEEFRGGTVEFLLTLPIPLWKIVISKFTAGWIFSTIATCFLTIPMWVTVSWLGTPDHGLIASGMLGSILIASSFIGIGSLISSMTSNQIIAFVTSVVASLLLTFNGIPAVITIIEQWIPLPIVTAITKFAFLSYFHDISKGIVELNALFFFATFATMTLLLNILVLSLRKGYGDTSKENNGNITDVLLYWRSRVWMPVGFIIIMFLSLNLIFSSVFKGIQWDMTQENLYTLTQETRNVLKGLQEPVHIRLFYSEDNKLKMSAIGAYAERVKGLIQQYSKISGGMVVYEFIDPQPFSPEEDVALSFGIQGSNTSSSTHDSIYFGLVITGATDEVRATPFLDLSRENLLEYDITQAIYEVSTSDPIVVGYIGDIDPDGFGEHAERSNLSTLLFSQLINSYDFRKINLAEATIPQDTDVLFIVEPVSIDMDQWYMVDQFVMRGGKILLFTNARSARYNSYASVNNIEHEAPVHLLNSWGINIDRDNVITSFKYSPNDKTQYDDNIAPSLLYLDKNNLNIDDTVTSGLSRIMIDGGAHIMPVENQNSLAISPMLYVQDNAMLLHVQEVEDVSWVRKVFSPTNKTYNLAVRISGKPASAFTDNEGDSHLSMAEHDTSIIVVSDTNILEDRYWVVTQQFREHILMFPVTDNANFVMNAIDNLGGGVALINLRSRGSVVHRTFEVIDQKQHDANMVFSKQEQILSQKLSDLRTKLGNIQAQSGFKESLLFDEEINYEQETVVEAFRQELLITRSQLRDIHSKLRQDVENIGYWITFIHVFLLPFLIITPGFFTPNILRKLWGRRKNEGAAYD